MSGPPSMKYAHVERELRFLLARRPAGALVERTLALHDRYLTGTRLRLRLIEEAGRPAVWKLGQKLRLAESSPLQLAHTTVYLDAAEAALLRGLPGAELSKSREIVQIAGTRWAVDSFAGALEGLILAEHDLGADSDGPVAPPPGTVAEVSDDERFTGAALAHTSAAQLRSTLASYGDCAEVD